MSGPKSVSHSVSAEVAAAAAERERRRVRREQLQARGAVLSRELTQVAERWREAGRRYGDAFPAWPHGEAPLEWTLSAQRMKAKREHRVPLCDRALEVLEAARVLGDGNPLVFPMRSGRPISASTLLKTLNDLRIEPCRTGIAHLVSVGVQHRSGMPINY